MGKIRHVLIGDESEEKEQKRRSEARREGKKARKHKETNDTDNVVTVPESEADLKPAKEKKTDKTVKETGRQPKKRSKKYLEAIKLVDRTKLYPLTEAVALMKKTSVASFDGTVELHINLNVNTLGDKKDIRGIVTLPHGSGKKIRVKIADESVISTIESGTIDFDVLVAHPSMMPKLAKVARILGPKGLMPNPKIGTVTPDPDKKVAELSKGQVTYKTEPANPIIHQAVGKVSFTDAQISENITVLLNHIGKNKLTSVTLTSSMGPGIKLAIE